MAIIDLQQNYNCVGILHDKDIYEEDTEEHVKGELKKEHFHFVVRFKNAMYKHSIAKKLNIEERFLDVTNSFKASAQYLTHYGYEDKFQYNLDDLVGNLKNEVIALCDERTEDDKMLELIKTLDNTECYVEFKDFLFICCSNGLYDIARKNQLFVCNMLKEHNAKY